MLDWDRGDPLQPRSARVSPVPSTLTLFDLVSALRGTGASDGEVVAAVADLVARGRVRFARNLDGADA